MSEERADLMLEPLRASRGDIADVKTDLVEVNHRLGLFETQYANVSGQVDRIAGNNWPDQASA